MAAGLNLGAPFDSFVQAQLDSGRYNDARDVVRDGLRLLERREHLRAAFDRRMAASLADERAGRVRDADEVFDELEAELSDPADNDER
jgi:antitoxin ParD1/3/4